MRLDLTTRFGWKLRVTLAATLSASGCSMLNPYDTVPDRPTTPVPAVEGMRLAGGASESLQTAEQMRQIYFNNLKYTAYVRSGTAIAAGTLTGWTLYSALQPASLSNGGDTKRRLRLAATLATLFGLREVFVNPEQESVYADGYRSLTCLMLQSAPLLMTELAPRAPQPEATSPPAEPEFIDNSLLGGMRPKAFSAAVAAKKIKEPPNPLVKEPSQNLRDEPAAALLKNLLDHPFEALLPAFTDKRLGDLDRLQLALDQLETLILAVNLMTSEEKAKADIATGGNLDVKKSQGGRRKQLNESEEALRYARNALSDGRALVRVIKGSGEQIRNRVGVIVGSVNEDVQGRQKSVGKTVDSKSIGDAKDITSTMMNIGVSTATDQLTMASDSPASWNRLNRDAVLLAGPMSAIGDRLKTRDIDEVSIDRSIRLFAQAGRNETSPLLRVPGATTAKPPAKAALPVAAKAAPANFTEGELKALRDSLDGMLKGLSKRDEEAALKAREEAAAASVVSANSEPTDPQATRRLANGIEMLYAARRPVVHELVNFRRRARDAAAVPDCADLAVLRVRPNEVVRAHRGDSLTYIISQRAPGNPFAVLQGPQESEQGVKFEFKAVEGTTLHRAVIKVNAQMPKQTISLVVTDSTGAVSQTVSIVAGGR